MVRSTHGNGRPISNSLVELLTLSHRDRVSCFTKPIKGERKST
jgi:hypothetical protein